MYTFAENQQDDTKITFSCSSLELGQSDVIENSIKQGGGGAIFIAELRAQNTV